MEGLREDGSEEGEAEEKVKRLAHRALALILLMAGLVAQTCFSPEQQVSQLMVPAVAAGRVLGDAKALEALEHQARHSLIGGVHMLRAKAREVAALSARLQALAPHPLFITADCEGGAGIMFPGATRFPRGLALAAANDLLLTQRVGERTAEEAALLGVNVIFAPVADVNSSPTNPIINLRSFGDQPVRVAEQVVAFGTAVERAGLMAVAKHFPGHGDTHEDSHLGLPVVDLDLAELEARELVPFREAVASGISGVMSAHIAWPKLGGADAWPATLEPRVVREILREKLGFKGVVFTDALDMGGITRRTTPAEAAVRAVLAGCDVLLFPTDMPAMRSALIRAARSGDMPPSFLEQAKDRVRRARSRWKHARATAPEHLAPLLDTDEARDLAEECARRGCVRLRDRNGAVPLRILVLQDPNEDWGFDHVPGAFLGELSRLGVKAEVQHFSGRESSSAPRLRADAGTIVLSAASLSPAGDSAAQDAAERRRALLREAVTADAAVVLLGNPLAHGALPQGHGALLFGLDFDDHTQRALVRAFMGKGLAEGHLPLAVPGIAERGAGLGR